MNSSLHQIHFYQLDNLITNRVPFFFLNFGPSIVSWYSSVSKLHLENFEIIVNTENFAQNLESRSASKNSAIVLLCEDGSLSTDVCNRLLKQDYTNVYVIYGGYRQLVTERSQN